MEHEFALLGVREMDNESDVSPREQPPAEEPSVAEAYGKAVAGLNDIRDSEIDSSMNRR